LVRSIDDGRVGLVSNGVVRQVAGPPTMTKYWFNAARIINIPPSSAIRCRKPQSAANTISP